MAELGGTGRGRDPFVTIEVDAQLVVRAWNVRAEQAFGAGPEAAIGRPIAALVPVVGGDTRWRAMLAEDEAAYVWPLADDAVQRSFEWVHTCLYDADGRVRGAICYGRDVTERVEATRRLELDRVILTTIVDTVHISLWAIDAGGLFTMMTGGPTSAQASSVVGRSIFELYGDNPGTVNLRRALAGEAQHNFASTGGQEWESWMVPIATRRPPSRSSPPPCPHRRTATRSRPRCRPTPRPAIEHLPCPHCRGHRSLRTRAGAPCASSTPVATTSATCSLAIFDPTLASRANRSCAATSARSPARSSFSVRFSPVDR